MPSNLHCGVVLTTVYASDILTEYLENFRRSGHLDDVEAIVIGDQKTPATVPDSCRETSAQGLRATYLSIVDQETYLAKFGRFSKLIPYNSDNRRNVGYLLALDRGADFIISIDDDNFCCKDSDVYAEHARVCAPAGPLDVVRTGTGWFNVCDLLQLDPAHRVYARGFPYRWRHRQEIPREEAAFGRIAINAGLWLGDPDLDGLTWLVAPVRATGSVAKAAVLAHDTWSPINSQNTALRRDAAGAYYFAKMGYRLEGTTIDRYGDIFSGYFALACTRHMGEFVRFGSPLAHHRRNSHNYLRDATAELPCIWILEDLIEWLREAQLEGTSYCQAYRSLSHLLEDAAESFQGSIWTDSTRGYIHQLAYHMREWIKCCELLEGTRC
jgi:hypothetical protein